MTLTLQFVVVFLMGFFSGIGAIVSVGYLLGERQRRMKAREQMNDDTVGKP